MLDDFMWRRRLEDARALLETEKALLLSGAVKELPGLDPRRNAVVRRLRGAPETILKKHARVVRRIRTLAARNHTLLSAYLDGAREAARRLTSLEVEMRTIGAYQRDGSPLKQSVRTSSTIQRA